MSARPHPQLTPTRTGTTSAALRFITCGSVDDGKSTLIGRLLVDSKSVLQDQLAGVQRVGRNRPGAADRRPVGRARARHHHRRGLPLLRHAGPQVHHRRRAGPRAVHAQHGHGRLQRRRRRGAGRRDQAAMAGPRSCELLPQTRRHSLLVNLLRVPSIVFAVNKLDAVDDPDAGVRQHPRRAGRLHRSRRRSRCAAIVPISALKGHNVVTPQPGWCGYQGLSLLQLLEQLDVDGSRNRPKPFAFPVQWVEKFSSSADTSQGRRVFWGRVATGRVEPGSTSRCCPAARPRPWPRCSTMRASRGRCAPATAPASCWTARSTSRAATGCWRPARRRPRASSRPPSPGWTTSRWSRAASTGRCTATAGSRPRSSASSTSWTSTRWPRHDADHLEPNSIGHVDLALQEPLATLPYLRSRILGSLVLVDTASHKTSGAVLVRAPQ